MAGRTRAESALAITAASSGIVGAICIALMFSVRGGVYLLIVGFLLLLLAVASFVGLLVVKSLRRAP